MSNLFDDFDLDIQKSGDDHIYVPNGVPCDGGRQSILVACVTVGGSCLIHTCTCPINTCTCAPPSHCNCPSRPPSICGCPNGYGGYY